MADIFTAADYAGEYKPVKRHNKRTTPLGAVVVIQMHCAEEPACAVDHVEAVERLVAAMPGVDRVDVDWE